MTVALQYNRASVPTIREFMASDAFIRGLMGPFGCLPADAEFLSPSGWVRMDEWAVGTSVAQWSPDGSASFVTPSAYVDKPSGDFILFDSGSLVMALSPEHRVPYFDWEGKFSVVTADQMAKKPSRRTIPTTFGCPAMGHLDMSDDLIRFAVMMHADGYYPKEGKRAQICVRKERKKDRIRRLLASLGVEWKEHPHSTRPTELTFSFVPPYVGKRFDAQWWGASAHQLSIVLDEICHWDGLHDHVECVFSTSDKGDADFIQYAAHATGRRACIHAQSYSKPGWRTNYLVRIRCGDNPKNRASVRERTKIGSIPSIDGRKYCFTVPSGFFVARYRDSVFVTGNSGKSSGCVWEIVRRGLMQRPDPDGVRRSRWAVIRNSYRQLEDTTIRTVHQWFPPLQFGKWRPTDHSYVINRLTAPGDDKPAEIEFLFRALDRPDQVGNLLSLELTGAWVNEAREVPWAIIEAVQGRVGRYPSKKDGGASWCGIIMDTNPPDTESAWYKFFEEDDHSEAVESLAQVIPGMTLDQYMRIFKQPSGRGAHAENLDNLVQGYYHRLAIGKSQEYVKVYIDGKYGFVMDGKPVFPEFEDSFHTRECKTVADLPVYRGWDFGLTPACVFSQMLPSGQWIVVDELVATSMGVDRFSDEVLDHSARHFPRTEFIDVGDPAGMQKAQTDERTCFEILHAKGIEIEPGMQTLAIRLESVRRPLSTLVSGARPGFVLHPRCKTLRRGFMGGYQYRRMQTSGEKFTDKPDKNRWSHAMDALQYVATRLFGAGLRSAGVRDDSDDYNERLDDQTRSSITGY